MEFVAVKFQKDRSKPANGNINASVRKGVKSYPQCTPYSANTKRSIDRPRTAGRPAFEIELPVVQVVIPSSLTRSVGRQLLNKRNGSSVGVDFKLLCLCMYACGGQQ